jgi:hypothetical protein
VSPGVYINYASLSPKQQKRTVTQIMQKPTCKLTNQEATAKRRRRKFTSPTGSGESSCSYQPRDRSTHKFKKGSFNGISICIASTLNEAEGAKRGVKKKPRKLQHDKWSILGRIQR